MSEGAASLTLVILIGGFLSLVALTYWGYRKDQYSQSMHKGNDRIRRELMNHTGDTNHDH